MPTSTARSAPTTAAAENAVAARPVSVTPRSDHEPHDERPEEQRERSERRPARDVVPPRQPARTDRLGRRRRRHADAEGEHARPDVPVGRQLTPAHRVGAARDAGRRTVITRPSALRVGGLDTSDPSAGRAPRATGRRGARPGENSSRDLLRHRVDRRLQTGRRPVERWRAPTQRPAARARGRGRPVRRRPPCSRSGRSLDVAQMTEDRREVAVGVQQDRTARRT